jgi:hypothetical protein
MNGLFSVLVLSLTYISQISLLQDFSVDSYRSMDSHDFELNELPEEVLYNICECLGKLDLAQLRLVSSHYAAIAARSMFKQLGLMFSVRSLQGLTSISQHPVYCKYVQAIGYRSAPLINDFELYRFKEVMELLRGRNLRSNTGGSLVKCPMRDEYDTTVDDNALRGAFTQYQRTCTEQKFMRKHNIESAIFVEALSRLTNLRSLIIEGDQFDTFVTYEHGPQQSHVLLDGDETFIPIYFKQLEGQWDSSDRVEPF